MALQNDLHIFITKNTIKGEKTSKTTEIMWTSIILFNWTIILSFIISPGAFVST